MIQLSKVYSVSRGKLISANRKFNQTGHPMEISLTADSYISELSSFNKMDFPMITYNFKKIMDLKDVSPDSEIDTIGVCIDSHLFHNNSQRSILILDDSLAEIRVSIWNLSPEKFNSPLISIIAFRRAKMTHKRFGRFLTVSGRATVEINPDIPEVAPLAEWYSLHGDRAVTTSLTKGVFGDISLISALPVDLMDDQVIYTNLDVTISDISGLIYQSCAICFHKIKLYKGDIPVCETCMDTEPVLINQLVLTIHVYDASGSASLVAFTSTALELLDKDIDDLSTLDEELSSLLETFNEKKFKFNIKTRKTTFHVLVNMIIDLSLYRSLLKEI
ncbi:replication factor A protein 1-like isoform X1 [Tetranychus urticae]|uniref:Replication factor A C-terminal domain-containing protein n=1 Tax=Tetranychus urticae TaxID=32264 RepID=T1KUL3_TETUR|nr:replication factor A protein 1-like isoform X1 [Tetranychus urticae]XP_015790777.1 replication factor A protein 1-like isoform X1 [Tetranychus urticae]XP_015790778.1 replication factor A protein 1-like isoform X1 [Tetranychus urticae]XP_015790779.1 replication factor A protein 1-like isoform X1 [Tetranychus urticae]XP_015790780.1 replication factor A protein 1-like isoform X1 [Tetranychus urticae]XP_015790781.1 replication factor A protein 1-like isoform X1 [Tetranychus urticae]XP_01579078